MTQCPTEEMMRVGVEAAEKQFWENVSSHDVKAIYLAMKAAEPLPEGDEQRSVDVELQEAESVLRAHQHYDLAQTVSELRAALVRSKPIDRDEVERVARAMAERIGYGSDAWNSRGFKIDSLTDLARAAITAIGIQSIEGERG